MCHKSGVQSAQIEKFVEHGMPQKIVKTVQYTIKKRAAEEQLKLDKIQIAADEAAAKAKIAQYHHGKTAAATDMAMGTVSISDRLKLFAGASAGGGGGGGGCPFGHLRKNKKSITTTTTNIADISGVNAPSGLLETTQNKQNNNNNNVYTEDVLAKGTLWTKMLTERLSQEIEHFQSSKIYILLTKTTQPAHLIAICILSLTLLTVWPEIIQNATSSELAASKTEQQQNYHNQQQQSSTNRGRHPMAVLAYLGAFATHFGAQIWMTFVSGLSLYFALPRHIFGQCQQILFPKYFALNSVLSISMFLIFVKFLLGSWCFAECVQLSTLALTAIIEVTIRLYLAPPMLRLMHEKYRIEEAVGSGQEVGGLVQGDLVQCPHYQRIHKTFRRIHMTIAIGNIVILLCTCLHMYYLASKISFQ